MLEKYQYVDELSINFDDTKSVLIRIASLWQRLGHKMVNDAIR
jgi:hypothetical protein